MELSKTFEPKAAEERWYQEWIDRGYFTADPQKPGEAFSIVIPPPNVTGQLHLGHALNVTLQDAIVRTRRMQGRNTLWVPGTDHAGIATQNVVEREIGKEGLNRHQLGRAAFEHRCHALNASSGPALPSDIDIRCARRFEREAHKLAAPLDARPVVELVRHMNPLSENG